MPLDPQAEILSFQLTQLHIIWRDREGIGDRGYCLSEPGYTLPEMVHIPHGLIVPKHLTFIAAQTQVPIVDPGTIIQDMRNM